MKKTEILAPAGSMESVYAAVRNGADAIYLGGSEFSARQNAANFTEEELKQAVDYCHLHDVKVHQAINILLFDRQLKEVSEVAKMSAKSGVDAFIVQDLGVAHIIRQTVPDIPLHASTQMSIHSPEGAIFAKELGFERVVVARELSLLQIMEICKTGVEIEAFVHGALCMCVSGQCYMSAMIGQRSANRGLCAQACRLPMNVGSAEYALSLKDMSLVEDIKKMSEAGVTSFKIEGRMKRPEYVAAAVTACRKALSGENIDSIALRSVFSRGGFTDGYYKNKIDKNMFGIREKEDVISAEDVLPTLRESYRKENKEYSVDFTIKIKVGEKISLKAVSCGCEAMIEGGFPEVANNRPTDIEAVKMQLSKLGDTVFIIGEVNGEIDDGLIVRASELNSVRRQVIKELEEQITVKNTPEYTYSEPEITIKKIQNTNKFKIRTELSSLAEIEKLELSNIEKIIAPVSEILKYADKLTDIKEKLIAAPERFMTDEKKTAENLKKLAGMGYDSIYCSNVAHIEIGRKLNMKLFGAFGLNVLNSCTLKKLKECGLVDATVSFEMKLNEIAALSEYMPFGIIGYGNLPVMLVRNCPIKSEVGCTNCTGKLSDKNGREFKVVCNKETSEILNCDTLYLADRLAELKNISFVTLKFTTEKASGINKIIREYQNGGEPTGHFTRGLYTRGII